MSLRAPKDTIESLRLTLQCLEETSDSSQDPDARAELRRILLLRIANLEAIEALKAGVPSQVSSPALLTVSSPPPELPQQLVARSSDKPETTQTKDPSPA